MGLRRRASTILLLPIAVFIFMIGWVLIQMEKQQDKRRIKAPVTEQGTTDEYLEVGIIEDLMEKTLRAE